MVTFLFHSVIYNNYTMFMSCLQDSRINLNGDSKGLNYLYKLFTNFFVNSSIY